MADDLTAALNRISAELRTSGASDEDTARLLAAVEKVLELTDGPIGLEGRGLPGDGLAVRRAVREVITRELTGPR
jgi:hypothetical protein